MIGFKMKRAALSIGLLAVLSSVGAQASPLLVFSVEGSLTGAAGTYSNDVIAVPGTSIYYEVIAQSAPVGTVNSNTSKTPNGTQDSFSSLNVFSLTAGSGDTFTSATGASYSTGTGANGGNVSGNTVTDVRTITSGGAYINDDTAQVIVSGQLTVGSLSPDSIFATEDTTSSSALKIAGTSPLAIVGANTATETSGDPLLSFANALTIGPPALTPEPSSIALIALCSSAVLNRRRKV